METRCSSEKDSGVVERPVSSGRPCQIQSRGGLPNHSTCMQESGPFGDPCFTLVRARSSWSRAPRSDCCRHFDTYSWANFKKGDLKPHRMRYYMDSAAKQDPIEIAFRSAIVCKLYLQAPEFYARGIHTVSCDEKTGAHACCRGLLACATKVRRLFSQFA